VSNTGVLVKSFDPLTGTLLESRYPSPADERIKKTRGQVRRAAKESRDVSLNEASAQYMEFEAHFIHDQKALDAFARSAYEQFSRQEMTGSFHTAEMVVSAGKPGEEIDFPILELMPGDCLYIGVHEEAILYAQTLDSEARRVAYLTERCGYDPNLALLCVRNIDVHGLKSPIFHLESMEVHLQPKAFDIEIKFHNKVNLLEEGSST
jgi:hypothetical protein